MMLLMLSKKNFHLVPSEKITKIKHQNHPEWNEIASNEIVIKTVFFTLMSKPLGMVYESDIVSGSLFQAL